MSTLITLSDVSFSYDQRRDILSHFSLSIEERDFIVLRGKNGGGKTSLLKIISGLLSPTSGTIRRAEGLTTGYLPQHRSIDRQFPITVFQTVRSGLQCTLPWWKSFGQSERATTLHPRDAQSLRTCRSSYRLPERRSVATHPFSTCLGEFATIIAPR